MSARQLNEWMEYEKLEPFGALRDNFHAGVVAAVLANIHRDVSRVPSPYTPRDFFFVDSATADIQHDAQMLGSLRAVAKRKKKAKVN